MRVDKPEFECGGVGEVTDCDLRPLDSGGFGPTEACYRWHVAHNFTCPTSKQYAEACILADQIKGGE